MPLLYLAQNQNENWIPLAAMKYIGKFLSMPLHKRLRDSYFLQYV